MTEEKCSLMTGPMSRFTKAPLGTSQAMSPAQEAHLSRIQEQFAADVSAKYRAGVREHGGNLWQQTTLQLIEEGMAEAVDQYTYLMTARDQLLGIT